jgi:CO/xanthine dehydrogenase Mo-binding subunit
MRAPLLIATQYAISLRARQSSEPVWRCTGEINAAGGVIDQSNFADYPVWRLNEAPEQVNTHIVESDAPPVGLGEPSLPPFAPALYNAVFAATGNRVRELPRLKRKVTG